MKRQSLLGNPGHLGDVMCLLQPGWPLPSQTAISRTSALEMEVGGNALPRSLFLRNTAAPGLLREYDCVLDASEKQLPVLQYIQTDIYKVYI